MEQLGEQSYLVFGNLGLLKRLGEVRVLGFGLRVSGFVFAVWGLLSPCQQV